MRSFTRYIAAFINIVVKVPAGLTIIALIPLGLGVILYNGAHFPAPSVDDPHTLWRCIKVVLSGIWIFLAFPLLCLAAWVGISFGCAWIIFEWDMTDYFYVKPKRRYS